MGLYQNLKVHETMYLCQFWGLLDHMNTNQQFGTDLCGGHFEIV